MEVESESPHISPGRWWHDEKQFIFSTSTGSMEGVAGNRRRWARPFDIKQLLQINQSVIGIGKVDSVVQLVQEFRSVARQKVENIDMAFLKSA